ncbi:MAG: leucine-rich repeat protein [Clostridiaceae bacterium]|nr:leucine-rich repeat protein [Clostridiaceae bacterium]
MKKALAIMLSIIMLISMMPATVFAGNDNPAGNNGPADVDWAFIRFYYDGDDQATDIGTVYENQTAYNNAVPGATYDAASNTLTIDNYRHPENALSVNMMGNDFRLNIVGECELSTVIVWGDGWGGSITVTGDGALTVNEYRNAPHAIQLNAEYVEASLTVDADVTLNLYGDEGVFSSYTNMFESPEDVVKALGGRDSFELNGAPFYYQNSQYIKAFEITDSQTDGYKGNAAVKQDDPDAYYGVSIWTGSSGQKTYHVSKYIYSQTYGIYLKDTAFDEQYGNDWGEVEFTKSEFDSLGFSMTVTGKELSSIFFFDSNAHSGPQLINANDPDGIYMLDHNGYSYSDRNDPATYTFKGTIYKLINGEYGYEKDTGFTPITIGQNDYEALPTGFTPVMDDEYQDLYLTGTVNEISGNLHVDSQDNEYIVYNNWNNGQSHEYVYAISEVPEIPGCYVATYVEDIAGVENHGYSEVTVPEDTGTYEFTTDVTEFSFTADYDWDEEHIIHFKDATVIDSDTVIFGEGNDAITLDIVNAQLDENGNILTYRGNELYNIEFVLSGNFDSDSMSLYVLALDGYRGEMFINDGNTASFRSNDENEEDLHFPYEVYISLDSFIPYVVAEDNYGNTYLDGDTLIIEQGKSVFVGFFTSDENWLHGIFPSYGFNYGVEGEGNFADSLTSMGFEVTEGVGEDFNLGTDRYNGVYGCLITAPANLEAGTRARMPFSLYELPDNFSWDDMWANFSWSDTPKVLENNMYIEVAADDNTTDDYTTGDCTWNYDADSKTLTISGNGAMADYGFIPGANEPVAAPWSNLDIEKVIIEDGVTRIGNDAFMGSGIYDADIADSVTSIGTNAFHSCGALDFVMLPHALTEVGAYAFYKTNLSEIEIPSTVTSIGQCAFGFYYDGALDRDMPVDGFEIYGYAGTEAETYADTYGFTFHDNTVYLSRDGLWKYSIRPDGAAMLYSDVFQGYSYQGNDTVVTIPSTIDGYTVKELGAFSMSGLTNVTKITVPDSVESIGFSAFSGCTNLSELVLGNNITEIGAQVIDNTAIPYKDGAVYCNGYLLRVDTNCEGMFIVNPGTKLMAMFSFGNCNKIERIILPDSINKIDYATFVGCTSLKEILIPHSVGFIYDGAFTDYNEQTGQEERSLERIYGSPNTGAHAFAEQNNIPFVNIEEIIDGDINGDGEVTLPDYQITRDYIAGNDLTIYGIIAGDVNGDDAVDAFDLFEIDKAINANAQPKFTYTVDNGLAYITSYTDDKELMVVPDYIEGYKVIELDANAFKNNTVIKEAIVSGNVETIDNYAFSGCSKLERIDFASGLKSIKYGSFLNCAKLDNVILPETVTSIGSYAFKGCTSLTTIQIPSSVTTIQATAFTGCTNLTIYGYAGSYAQSFATANNINFVAIG